MTESINKLLVCSEMSIKSAMKLMDIGAEKTLIVVDVDRRLVGVLTDGDIRRLILKTGTLAGTVKECFNDKPLFVFEGTELVHVKKLMLEKKVQLIPVVDREMRVVDVKVWSTLFDGLRSQNIPAQLACPVVIMAGGKGTRLEPFTRIFPKPLIPVGEKPIIELIMDRFREYGVEDFYLTVNYKGEMIKSYFDNVKIDYRLHYLWEKEFLGTAGCLKNLPENFADDFIVSNCDILLDVNYREVFEFHRDNGNMLTIIGALQHVVVPYGVLEFSGNGFLDKISEKPEYDITISTGVYVLNKAVLEHIPADTRFDATDLIASLMQSGKKVSVFPVSEKSYIDIGQWKEYRKNVAQFMDVIND
jgi:dTDP-glucose pyrophosphorylase